MTSQLLLIIVSMLANRSCLILTSLSLIGFMGRKLLCQMAELFNQDLSLSGKIPCGVFNYVFGFSGCWQKDAASTRNLAFDGWFLTLYTVALAKSHIVLRNHVKQAVPSSWDPAALARFIERFGTHVVVGVKMGGKDVVYLKQLQSSSLPASDVKKKLTEMTDKRFLDLNQQIATGSSEPSAGDKLLIREQRLRFAEPMPASPFLNLEDIIISFRRRGGSTKSDLPHDEWLNTVQQDPDVISMSFVPITSLLNGVPGGGFLSHAINLYLRYKPQIEELQQFLEFQLPRQWAPVFSDLPLGPQRRKQSKTYLQFSFMGPKLFVDTSPVDVGKRPVTGLRLYLEGRRSNRLAIHLQHLASAPPSLQIQDLPHHIALPPDSSEPKYYEPIQWRSFSHVCTAPVEADDDNSIVTGAQLHVGNHGLNKVLFLRLHFSSVVNAVKVKSAEWATSPALTQKSGLVSTLISTHFTAAFQKAAAPSPALPVDVNINSAVYPGGPPVPVQASKVKKFVDCAEMARGPQDPPGYWLISGARLFVERSRISLRVKYSLLTAAGEDLDEFEDLETGPGFGYPP
ncbi:MACPF domain-containing protein At4g24290-like isoform X2 [Wolffia australiana]